jgi:hypothetical protein
MSHLHLKVLFKVESFTHLIVFFESSEIPDFKEY